MSTVHCPPIILMAIALSLPMDVWCLFASLRTPNRTKHCIQPATLAPLNAHRGASTAAHPSDAVVDDANRPSRYDRLFRTSALLLSNRMSYDSVPCHTCAPIDVDEPSDSDGRFAEMVDADARFVAQLLLGNVGIRRPQ